ncbi:MAG: hypothetical protein U0Q16_23600 [Bryobacteraceae bacterium]
MAAGLWHYLGQPIERDPLTRLRERVQRRDESFLHLVRDAAYGFPESSLCLMLRGAKCEYSDLEAMVRSRGLDSTLRQLCDAGVYLTHNELKGKEPLVRHGREIPGGERNFRNPLVRGRVEGRSSGSRSGGRGTPTPKSTEFQVYREAHDCLWTEEFHLASAEWLQVRQILPSNAGLSSALRAARLGWPMSRWFTVPTPLVESGHYRMATAAMIHLARLRGLRVPSPETLPPNDFSTVARHIAGKKIAVFAFASPAVRVASAALDLGLDLSGTTFFSGGEATSPAKRAIVARSGARMSTIYHISEVGPVGYGCRHMQCNDVHLLMDSVAAITRRRPAPLAGGEPVDALAFTTLLPFAPRVLINAEMDDMGSVETGVRCDCTFGRLGMTTVIRDIASFGKLTGQGMTLYGVDVLRILEQALPERFGGGPGDYQLVERDLGAQTEVELWVSPRVVPDRVDLAAIRDYFVERLHDYYGGRMAAQVWAHSGTLRAVRREPVPTYSGKILPLTLIGQQMTGQQKEQVTAR